VLTYYNRLLVVRTPRPLLLYKIVESLINNSEYVFTCVTASVRYVHFCVPCFFAYVVLVVLQRHFPRGRAYLTRTHLAKT